MPLRARLLSNSPVSYSSTSTSKMSSSSPTQPKIPPSKTLIYKRIGNLNIELELYLPSTLNNAPVLLWFHGGGLLQGQRKSVAPHMLRGVERYGFVLVSADYRLAPQVPASAILTDVLDCITYIRTTLLTAANLTPKQVNTAKLIVSGSSAGGYLALLSALHASPPPTAILAIYPITDPLGPFFTTPQPHSDGHIARETVAEFLDPKAEAVSGNPPDSRRGKMYYWMLQTASLAELLSVTESDVEMRIARAITARGVGQGGKLPPVYVVHGDKDRAVGVEQADEVVEVIRDVGGTVEYERVEGVDHLFDKKEEVELEEMYKFMMRYV